MHLTGSPILDALLFTLFAMGVIYRASGAFETASEYIGRNLTDGVRGATINAIASSVPEVLTTLFFLVYLQQAGGFAGGIGTTAGSAIFNGMIIPAAVILVVLGFGVARSIQVSRRVLLRDGLALLACELILIGLISGATLHWWHGLILMLLYGGYLTFLLRSMRKASPEEVEVEEREVADDLAHAGAMSPLRALFTLDLTRLLIRGRPLTTASAWGLLVAATTVMAVACFLLVYACEELGEALGMPIYFVAVIIAAAATSVPDTIISIRDGLRGHYDDAISNALGSNIFDICFALGFPLFLYTLFYGEIRIAADFEVSELRIILFVLTALALLIYLAGRNMTVLKAVLLLGMYVIFVLYIVGKSTDNLLAEQVSAFIRQLLE